MPPTVSVVVPSFQGERRLPVLLEALANQVTASAYEVIVVLDGSTDRSSKVAHAFVDALNLRVVERARNLGRSLTLNEGFAAATGEVLIRCDDDLEPGPHYIQRFAEAIEREPESGVIGLYRNVYPDTPYAKVYGRPIDVRFRSEAYANPSEYNWRYWAGNCAVHRSTWEQVGPYDGETYRAYGWEDIDWGYRLAQAGGRIYLDRDLETIHHVAATTTGIRVDRARASGAAAAIFDAKHGTQSLGQPGGPWGHAVRLAAVKADENWGRSLDAVIGHLPPAAARKLVDFAIQVEFRRGYCAT